VTAEQVKAAHPSDPTPKETLPDMLEIATSGERLQSTSAPPVQVDLVATLGELARDIVAHNQSVLIGDGTADWAWITEQLSVAATSCRRQVVVMLTDIGDSGGR
jgi:hypothetical protein